VKKRGDRSHTRGVRGREPPRGPFSRCSSSWCRSPLGYEPHDNRLRRLGWYPVVVLASTDAHRLSAASPLHLPCLKMSHRVSCTNPCTRQALDLRVVEPLTRAPVELRITRVFSCAARGSKACASFMFAGCC
jgi:hypothetical protein